MQYRFLTMAVMEISETEPTHKGIARGLMKSSPHPPSTGIMNNNFTNWVSNEIRHSFGVSPGLFLSVAAQRVEFERGGATTTWEQQNCKYCLHDSG